MPKQTERKPAKRKLSSPKKKAPRKTSSPAGGGKQAASSRPHSGAGQESAPRRQPRDEALRKQLLEKRKEILEETQVEIAKYIKGENRQLVETALDDGDWSVIDLSEDINLRKLSTHRETLVKIEEALRKLDENTYGTCEDCGEQISAERLRVMPFAIRCRDCQEIREELEAAEKERGGELGQ